MNKIIHPMEPEELMAYLDGELSAEQAAITAAHLQECPDCQETVDGLRSLSKELGTWRVEIPVSKMAESVTIALDQIKAKPLGTGRDRWSSLDLFRNSWNPIAWAGGMAAIVIVLCVGTIRFVGSNANNVFSTVGQTLPMEARDSSRERPSARDKVSTSLMPPPPPPPTAGGQWREFYRPQQFAKLQRPPVVQFGANSGELAPSAPAGPMIIRTAELSLTTKDFDKARAAIETSLRRHRGYVADLKIGGAAGAGHTLTGSLRVPADQLDATIAELKTLGRVESESRGGQDVTSQYVDLQARLTNARNTEKRLTDLLSQRTGKLSDVLEVEREVDRVRGQIEQMEGERKTMASRVNFATVNISVSEDYKAQLEVVPPSTSTRLSNAAVEGYRSMVDGIMGVILFLLSNGPSLLLWTALLFLPARFAWKTLRRRLAHNA
jgi:hypothetical protein